MTRAQNVVRIQNLLARGLSSRQIASVTGLAYSTVREYIADPEGTKVAARRESYRGVCESCGNPTTGGDGPTKAPRLCLACTRKQKRAKHGTRSRYNTGCRCDECRRALREYARTLKDAPVPSHGTVSGYVNYGCRCDACKAAGAENNRRVRERRKAREAVA